SMAGSGRAIHARMITAKECGSEPTRPMTRIASQEALVQKLVVRFVMAAASIGVLAEIQPAAFSSPGTHAYVITTLASLGGTSSRGDSIKKLDWVAGFSNVSGDATRHATLCVAGVKIDLQTLGGPNSSVVWPVKNTTGILAGISQTAMPDPLNENWSCS